MNIVTIYFRIRTLTRVELPAYKGSTFRGALGHALKKTSCVVSGVACAQCPLFDKCAYAYLYETRNERGQSVAHPYVIEPPMTARQRYEAGKTLGLSLILMGRAREYVPYLIRAIREMGERGLGRGIGRFRLEEAWTLENGEKKGIYHSDDKRVFKPGESLNLLEIPPVETREVEIHFTTVTALKEKGRINLNPGFGTIIRAVYRRLKALAWYHEGKSIPEPPDMQNYEVRAVNINIRRGWWMRYSNRQERKINYEGITGSMRFKGDLTAFTPLLQIGRHIHIGRGTVYGMGKYELKIK